MRHQQNDFPENFLEVLKKVRFLPKAILNKCFEGSLTGLGLLKKRYIEQQTPSIQEESIAVFCAPKLFSSI